MIIKRNDSQGFGAYGTRVAISILPEVENLHRVTIEETKTGCLSIGLGGYRYTPGQAREVAAMLLKAVELIEAQKKP